MPIRDRVIWRGNSTFSDPRLKKLPDMVRSFKKRKLPSGWKHCIFENRDNMLPQKSYGHYHEFYIGPPRMSGSLRVVLGNNGEVYITGNHYDDFRQVLELPV